MKPLPATLVAIALATAVPTQTPCSSQLQANYGSPLLNNHWEFQDVWKRCYLVQNPHPYPIQMCRAAQRLSHNLGLLPLLGDPNVFFSWVQAVPLGNTFIPGLPLGSVTPAVTISYNQTTVCRSSFAIPLTLPPGQRVFLVANYWVPPLTVGGDWISSTLTHGATDVRSWYFQNGVWNQSLPNGYHYQLEYRPYLQAEVSSTSGGCGSNGSPSLTCSPPVLGGASTMTLGNLQPGSLAFHAIGFVDPDASMTGLGAPGCRQRTSGSITLAGFASPAGQLQIALGMPSDPAVLGVVYYAQGLGVDTAANPLGIAFSNGVAATIGSH